MEALGTFDGDGLTALLRRYQADFVETNEANGHVYKSRADGSTLVVYATRDGYRVTRIPASCAC